MALALTDRWIWDFWLARDGADHHLFFLQAPRGADPHRRHWEVSIGHAVSRDLVDWTILPDALAPGAAGAWDDASTWTGCVLRVGSTWVMPYTGTSSRDRGMIQRIGIAESDDLVHWRKHDRPVLEADAAIYETLGSGDWHDEAWRDPWVFRDERDGAFHMLFCARVARGERAGRGVVGHAVSDDLRTWRALPPVTEPMGFGQLEVPQVIEADGRWYLVFCSDMATQSGAVRERGLGTGTFYLVGDSPTGPFPADTLGTLSADLGEREYAGKLHRTTDGRLVFLAWQHTGSDGTFVGTLGDPRPVDVSPDGRLHVREEVAA